MSVYTSISHHDLVQFLSTYDLGELLHFEGISNGIENTNYFVTTTQGPFVLTLFETLKHQDLPYFLSILNCLDNCQIPSALAQADLQGEKLQTLHHKPTLLLSRLEGSSIEHPNETHCGIIGNILGQIHKNRNAFTEYRENDENNHWYQSTAEKLYPLLPEDEAKLLKSEIDFKCQLTVDHLPTGLIHADLFRDNVLFFQDRLSGVIDFYNACNDVLLYDLAIAANDWCRLPNGEFSDSHTQALLQAYHHERPLNEDEMHSWPDILRIMSLRFWLSRLHDLYFQKPGEVIHTKDPNVFKKILLQRKSLATSFDKQLSPKPCG